MLPGLPALLTGFGSVYSSRNVSDTSLSTVFKDQYLQFLKGTSLGNKIFK